MLPEYVGYPLLPHSPTSPFHEKKTSKKDVGKNLRVKAAASTTPRTI